MWLTPHIISDAAVVTYAQKPKEKAGVSLLEAAQATKAEAAQAVKDAEQAAVVAKNRPIISYLKPNLTVAIVDDFTKYPMTAIPPPVSFGPHLRV